MKNLIGIVFCMFALVATAQDYEQMPVSVQQKMDANKREGKNTYKGVYSVCQVELNGVTTQGIQTIERLIIKDARVKSHQISANGKQLMIQAEGEYGIKDVKEYLKNTGVFIEKYTVKYATELN